MAGEAAKGTMGIFIIFVLSRALHPMVIDYSKVDGKIEYSNNSPAIMSQLFSMIFVNFLAWQDEGMKGVKACWQIPQGASIFIIIGLWYAFGDFLEMLSMGEMSGGVYQLLLQSKLLITAVMMIYLKGTMQSNSANKKQGELQWSVLVAATLAISAFVIVDSGSDDDGAIPFVGVVMVLFKVGVSCYAAVLSDAKLKGFSNMSMSAKLSLMSMARVIASICIAAVIEPEAQPSYNPSAAPFFDHWTMATWIVTLSFTSKSLITLYLLKSLDGIQKNVGEARNLGFSLFPLISLSCPSYVLHESLSFSLSVPHHLQNASLLMRTWLFMVVHKRQKWCTEPGKMQRCSPSFLQVTQLPSKHVLLICGWWVSNRSG
eukprot:Skav215723  [mRNA]  locus=scaffold2573:699291:701691:- [translate_table: standard]